MADIPPNVPAVELPDDDDVRNKGPEVMEVSDDEVVQPAVEEIDWNNVFITSREYFGFTLSSSHALYPQCDLPKYAMKYLPRRPIDVVLRIGQDTWTMTYNSNPTRPKLGHGWGKFVVDNGLKEGDACVFEKKLASGSTVTLRVHILRDELPPALQERINKSMAGISIVDEDDGFEGDESVEARDADAEN